MFLDDEGDLEFIERRKFTRRLSVLVAVLIATIALNTMIGTTQGLLGYRSRGAQMGPLLHAIWAIVLIVMAWVAIPRFAHEWSPPTRVGAYMIVGGLEVGALALVILALT